MASLQTCYILLYLRLESKLDDIKSLATEGGDRHLLEYLFLSGPPADLQRLAEEGFPQPPSQALSNSLSLALEQGTAPQPLCRGMGGSGGVMHHVLIAKVLMSHCHKVSMSYSGVSSNVLNPLMLK